MAETIRQTEGDPATWPDTPALSTEAAALDPAVVWRRIEAHCAWRWGVRSIEWIVEGTGRWRAPLTPAAIATVEIWSSESWVAATAPLSPFGGYDFPGCGPYRITGTVGTDEPSGDVLEAFRRLAEYMAASPGKPGASSESVSAGSVSLSHSRPGDWLGRAMTNSGAADLLRRYRSLKC